MMSMECPWGSKEDNLTRVSGDEEKSDEIVTVGKVMEIQNTSSEN